MIPNLGKYSFINKLFNIHTNEWPHICKAWSIRFLYRISFVIGWTIIVALFVSKYGIHSLPYLFILNAFFTILGSLTYSFFVDRVNRISLITFTIFFAAFLLFFAYFAYDFNQILFFALLIFAEAIFIQQLRIMFNAQIEEMFNPLQSERTFPLIESSDTIGGVLGGMCVLFLSNVISIPSFILLWIIFLLLIIPIVQLTESKLFRFSFNSTCDKHAHFGIYKKLKNCLSDSTHVSFVLGLFLIVFFQWFLFNLLEFQYTKAIYQNVSNVVLEAGSGFEHSFIHDLGQFFILFSAAALLFQLFLAGRLIEHLGVIGSMLIHPIVTLFSLFGLTISFNYPFAILTKTNFTITSVLLNNTYHSTFYAIKEKIRSYIREIMDGIIRPIGAVFGTLFLIFLQNVFTGSDLIYYINILMIFIALFLLFITYQQQLKYTNVAITDLTKSKNKLIRFNAIDILSQKGHKRAIKCMRKILNSNNEPISIKIKILNAFSELQTIRVLDDILHCLKSQNKHLRSASLDTLISYKIFRKKSKRHLIFENGLIKILEDLYNHEHDKNIKSKIIKLLSIISSITTIDFLLNLLKKPNNKNKSDVIYALGKYDDPSLIPLLEPYLSSRETDLQIAAAISLYKFKNYQTKIKKIITKLLSVTNNAKVSLALYAVGELKLKNYIRYCNKYLNSNNLELKIQSSIALAKMGYYESIPIIIDLLFDTDKKLSNHIKNLLTNVDVRIYKNLDKMIKNHVSKKINSIIPNNTSFEPKDISIKNLKELKHLFCLSDEYEEVELINKYLYNS